MKLQAKVNLGILIVFLALAAGMALLGVNYVNTNTIREAENRVQIYMRAAWEIHNGEISQLRSALEVLVQDQTVKNYLDDLDDWYTAASLQEFLESLRREQGMDILNVLGPDGTVLLRTRSPYNKGDSLADDPMISTVIATGRSRAGNIILELERMDVEGDGLVERCIAVGGEPRGMMVGAAIPVYNGAQMLGIVQMGRLLNGATDEVDRIRDAVFVNEYYGDKPVGTATVFMGDMRVSTNVLDSQGRRAVGTRVSQEVAERVLENGLSWTGRAFVVDRWYLSQYDPIKDPTGKVIGILYVGELEQKYLDLRARTVAQQISAILVGMLFAFLIFFFIMRGILAPVREIYQATLAVTEGDLSCRVPVKHKDELGNLADSFNCMTMQLERQREEIESSQRELEALNAQLQQTNRNYMEMLGFVSHELKNPLASAVMSLYTVKDGFLGPITDAQAKSLDSVAFNLQYFHEMILSYLDLSRLEKGELDVSKAHVSLADEIVQPIVSGLERELQEKKMVLESHIPGTMAVYADRNLLKIVYDNLISNAIKYGRDGGRVTLDVYENTTKVTLSVWNESEGIPPEKMTQLFQKFSRLDNPEFAGKKGTGLGLYICKEIVEKHGGEIWVDSKIGEWVRFSFTLPK